MKGKLLTFGVSLLAVATIGVVQLQSKAVDNSRDCDRFAVIRCGTLNGDELRAEYDSNNAAGSNGDTTVRDDIKKVFTAMGISKADLQGGFKQGIVRKNGTVEVDGKVVATNAMTAARGLGGTQIPGTNAQKVSVSAMADAQTALVKLDSNGKFQYAVMKPCGNPVSATPKEEPQPPTPQPVAKCEGVKATMQERTKYMVTATASAKDGAKIKSYNFKVTTGSTTLVDKTYASDKETQSVVYQDLQPGEYKVKVTVDTSEGVKDGKECVATFTVAPEPTQPTPAVNLTKFVVKDGQKYALVNKDVEFSYLVTVTNTGSTDLTDVTVTDTPDSRITLLSVEPPTNATIKDNKLTVTKLSLLKNESRMFTIKAKVSQAYAGKIPNTACVDAPTVPGNPDKCDTADVEVPTTPTPPQIEVCVINDKTVRMVPKADVDANPTLYTTDLSQCKEVEIPEELPQTGPIETALSMIGAMSVVGSAAYYIASRRTA